MKKRNIILTAIGILVLLIISKPGEDRCKRSYEEDLKAVAQRDFLRDEGSMNLRADLAVNGANDYSRSVWEKYFEYHDYFLFCTVKASGLKSNKLVGVGILNCTFHL